MQILVLNSGSSSLKFQLFTMPEAIVACSGLVERIGLDNARLHFETQDKQIDETYDIPNHEKALELIAKHLLDPTNGILNSAKDIHAVGHRVVHGGRTFSETTFITNAVKDKIKALFELAPLHNPPNLEGIEVAEEIFSSAKQVAVFDTAFHQTMPAEAYQYAIPNAITEKGIRAYGFHGTSHKYVSEKAIAYLGTKASRIITVHLGNGCSITAVQNGKSLDHSLGFSPVNGLIMGTRSGDIDPSVVFYMINTLGYTPEQASNILQKESGMLGLTGYSDLRDIEKEAEKGNEKCLLALKMNTYRIKKYIGAYAAAMNGLDAIVFTAGIGENSSTIRSMVCDDMDFLGITLDKSLNQVREKSIREINTQASKVKILVIPTNEELEIAKQAYELINRDEN